MVYMVNVKDIAVNRIIRDREDRLLCFVCYVCYVFDLILAQSGLFCKTVWYHID